MTEKINYSPMLILTKAEAGEMRLRFNPKVFESIPMARPRSWGRWRIGRLMEVLCWLPSWDVIPSGLGWQRG